MRTLFIATVLTATFMSAPSAHAMGGPKAHGPKAGKHGGKGKHKGDKGKGKGGEGKGKQFLQITGAGQRLHFSFGGRIKHDPVSNAITGHFSIIVHPLSPPGDTVNVVCRYHELSNPQRTGNEFEFDATGKCRSLNLAGELSSQTVTSHVRIVDNPSGDDAIDVNLVGGTGVAIPGGALSHGGFTFVDPLG
jgi:hypothetical protein